MRLDQGMTTKRLAQYSMQSMDSAEMSVHADSAVQLLKSLSNRSRLMVLCLLSEGELSVGTLQCRLSVSQSALSQHLAVLRQQNLVKTRRESQTIFYSLYDPKAAQLVALLYEMFCPNPHDEA